jgi:hypothetical protein
MEITEDELMRLCSIYSNLGTMLESHQNSFKYDGESAESFQRISKERLISAYEAFKKNFPEGVIKKYPYMHTIERIINKK